MIKWKIITLIEESLKTRHADIEPCLSENRTQKAKKNDNNDCDINVRGDIYGGGFGDCRVIRNMC